MSFLVFAEEDEFPAGSSVARVYEQQMQRAKRNYKAALAWAIGTLLAAGLLLYIAAPKTIAQHQLSPISVSQTATPEVIEKNVEDIRAGDLVVSYDEATGQQVFNCVVETYERTSYHLRFIETRSLETGEVQTFETTDEHPFWQVDVGWVEAGELAVGDQLLQSNGKFAAVVSTRYEAHPEGVTVYNFQVADSHSYYVSAPRTRGPPVLVHNANYFGHGHTVTPPVIPVGQRGLPSKVVNQMANAGLPTYGTKPFKPKLIKNKSGDFIIEKGKITSGPKKGKIGYLDVEGNIWTKDRAHAGDPDHWDVQVDGGKDYFRVGLDGDPL